MNIEQLKYFQAITEHKTFLEAADEMSISQSSLSRHLIKLENELGVNLIDRSKRSASLTEAGKIFAKDVEILLAQYKTMLSNIQPFKNHNTLKIGSLAFLGQYGLNYKLADFVEAHKELKISVEDVEEDILIEGFREGNYDLIMGRTLPDDIKAECSVKLPDDELVAVMKSSNPLAKKKFINLKQIMSKSLFLTKSYTSIYKICQKIFAEHNLTPAKVSTSRSETIISMIIAQNAIGLLPRKCFYIYQHSGLVAIPIEPVIKIPVMIFIKRKNILRLAGDLIKLLKN